MLTAIFGGERRLGGRHLSATARAASGSSTFFALRAPSAAP